MLNIMASKVFSAGKNGDYIQVERSVEAVPIRLKPGSRSTIEDTHHTVSIGIGYSACCQDQSGTVPIIEDRIVKKGITSDL